MNVYAAMRSQVLAALDDLEAEGALPAGLDLRNVEVSAPREAGHGDLASNAAMVLAKAAGKKPREIAEALAQRLAKLPEVARTEVAGPGFINITLHPAFWHGIVTAIQAKRQDFARSDMGGGVATNVEYVSANPTGPMHVGHCRGAVFGDALANLLAFAGYEVTREYYINDAGAQVDVLAHSAFLRYREALGEDIGEIPAGLYPGDYLKPVGAALVAEHGHTLLNFPEERWLPLVRDAAIAAMLVQIKEDLAALAITHAVFFSERSLTAGKDSVRATIAELEKRGLIFQGRLEKPKGHDDAEWENREQTLFKSTSFGDDVDRAILKSDGSYTYFAADMAYHNDKLKRGFKHLINVFGADHVGYITRMKAAVAALSDNTVDLDIKVCQLVNLYRAGEPVRMSKRAGTFVTLREVVDEVGRDAVRFMMLYRKNDAPLDFDLAKVLEQTKDNPVFYVQYAHARAHSVFRNAGEVFPSLVDPRGPDIANADLSLLSDSGEIDLIKKLAAFPPVVEAAARAHEPHRLSFYLHDLAATFHSQWARGNEMPQLRFIQAEDRNLTAARLALIDATREVLGAGLAILGVHAPDEMR